MEAALAALNIRNDVDTLIVTARQRFTTDTHGRDARLIVAKRLVKAWQEWHETGESCEEMCEVIDRWNSLIGGGIVYNSESIWLAVHYLREYRKGE